MQDISNVSAMDIEILQQSIGVEMSKVVFVSQISLIDKIVKYIFCTDLAFFLLSGILFTWGLTSGWVWFGKCG